MPAWAKVARSVYSSRDPAAWQNARRVSLFCRDVHGPKAPGMEISVVLSPPSCLIGTHPAGQDKLILCR